MNAPAYRLWDADNHYYEVRDAFTRHIEARYRHSAIHAVKQPDGHEHYFCEDRLLAFCNVKYDRTEPPGSFKAILRNPKLDGFDSAREDGAMQEAFRTRHARLQLMDEQGVEATLMFPSVGNGIEHDLLDRPDVLYANLRAFNRWIEEDWGWGADGRIYSAACLSLADPDLAVDELERVLKAGARLIYLRPAPGGGTKPCSIADPRFDPFWARVQEANVPIGLHLSAGFFDHSADWGEDPHPGTRNTSALQFALFHVDIPVMTSIAAMIFHNLFGRFPGLRVLSVENGCGWVPYLMKTLNKAAMWGRYGAWPGGPLKDRPKDIFRRHVWVVPFHEDNTGELVKLIGAEHVLMGSDFPHAEGLARPAEFIESLVGMGEPVVRGIMRENLRGIMVGGSSGAL